MNSFSQEVKKEILETPKESDQELEFLRGIVKSLAVIKDDEIVIKFQSEERKKFLLRALKKYFNIDAIIKQNKLIFSVDSFPKNENLDISYITDFPKDKLASFLSGVFVARGYVNNPKSKFYHLEFRIKSLYDSITIEEALLDLEIKSKVTKKRGEYYVYIKRSTSISDLLKLFKASNAMFFFEDIRIERDFNNTLERINRIDIYNINKMSIASEQQGLICKEILLNNFKYKVENKFLGLANLRLKNKNVSLQELTDIFNSEYATNISKSTTYKWLNEMKKMVNE